MHPLGICFPYLVYYHRVVRHAGCDSACLMARVQLVSSISHCKSRVVPNIWMRLNIFTDSHLHEDIEMTYLGAPLASALSTIVSCSDCGTVSVMHCAITLAHFWMIFYGIVLVMVIPKWCVAEGEVQAAAPRRRSLLRTP